MSLRGLVRDQRAFLAKAVRGETLTFGRAIECDLAAPGYGFLSRHQFSLRFLAAEKRWEILGVGKTNLTYLNRQPLSLNGWTPINYGDTLEVVANKFVFDFPNITVRPVIPATQPELPSLALGQEIIIGRTQKSPTDFIISDQTVSGQHARWRNRGGVFEVMDLGSTNGTKLVNAQFPSGAPLPPRQWTDLDPGDILIFGRVRMTVPRGGKK